MSRIDEALRRLTGDDPEPQNASMLTRFASEERPPQRARQDDRPVDPRIARFESAHPRVEPPRAAPPQPVQTARHMPVTQLTTQSQDSNAADDAETLIDIGQLTDYLGFVYRSIGRRRFRVAITFVLAFTLTLVATALMPRTYHVEVQLLAQRNAVMASLSNPGRAVPWDADAPTRAAAETVLRRDNLISLIRQTDLLNEWDRRRAPILRFSDYVKAKILGHEPTTDEKLDALVTQLEKRMVVSAAPIGDGTVTIGLYWPDAEMAYRLVQHAQQAFLEARQVAETQAIAEAISILERYTNTLDNDINQTLAELNRTGGGGNNRQRPLPVTSAPLPTGPPASDPVSSTVVMPMVEPSSDPEMVDDPKLDRLKSDIAARRVELTQLETEQKRQLADLNDRLNKLLTIYTPNHPSVQTLEQNIAAARQSTVVATLRNELDQIETDYDERSAARAERLSNLTAGRQPTAPPPVPPTPRRLASVSAAPPASAEIGQRDRLPEFATLRLRTELSQLQSILERTDSARIELAVSQAAFKYRYTVIKPAEEPGEPTFPNVKVFIFLGLIASLLLAGGVGVVTDLMSNRILEAWQVHRQLGLPILGRVGAA